MDPPSPGDPSLIGCASLLFASLDLNGQQGVHSMETEVVMEVPDTPDRNATRYREETLAGGDASIPISMGFHRRDGSLRWQRKHKYERKISLSCNAPITSEKRSAGNLMLHEPKDYAHTRREFTGDKPGSRDAIQIHGRAEVGGEIEHEIFKSSTGMSLRSTVGSCDYRNGVTRTGSDINSYDVLDSTVQVICLESSPRASPAGHVVSGFASQLPVCSLDKGKRISTGQGSDLSSDSESKRVRTHSRSLKLDVLPLSTSDRTQMKNRYISSCNNEKGIDGGHQVGGKFSLFNDDTGRNKGKAIELSPDPIANTKGTVTSSSGVRSRPMNRKVNLVRNGCISPANIARTKCPIDEANNVDNDNPLVKNPQVDSSQQVCSSSSKADGYCHGKEKGKHILDEGHLCHGLEMATWPSRSRSRIMPVKCNSTVGDTEEGGSYFVQEKGWITTGNRKGLPNGVKAVTEAASPLPIHVQANNVDAGQRIHIIDDICPEFSTPQSRALRSNYVEISSGSSHNPASSRHQGNQRPTKGKRKIRSGRSFQGEYSTRESSTITSSPPELRQRYPRSGDSSVSAGPNERDLQVESDELLARQLQEQLFNESMGLGNFEEIDANIAWSLQQAEDAHTSVPSTRSQHQTQSRDSSMAHLYRRNYRHSSRNSSGQLPRQPRNMPRMSQLRRSLNRHHMDLEARLNYLEALEAVFDSRNDTNLPNSLLHLERDFNENDYEMLLGLDNENDKHAGASRRQINSLPLSVVQSENPEEACAICLDAPSIGDTIRHLPCLHKFHKDCIDEWLQRRSQCPVCKSGVT